MDFEKAIAGLYVIRTEREVARLNPPADEGCLECGAACDPGHVLCTLCIADKTRHVGDECAALVRDFMTASNRIAAVDDSGPTADLGLQATEAA